MPTYYSSFMIEGKLVVRADNADEAAQKMRDALTEAVTGEGAMDVVVSVDMEDEEDDEE